MNIRTNNFKDKYFTPCKVYNTLYNVQNESELHVDLDNKKKIV